MYECFHCGAKGVIWDADFSFEDFGLDGEGIVHCCHCSECGADITYYVPCERVQTAIEVREDKPIVTYGDLSDCLDKMMSK